jgi:hypothetical protein
MGAVPVLVGSNPFAAGVDEQHGALPVASFEELPAAVTQLLADPPRLELLSARGRETARDELAWEPYVERVDRALSSPATARDPGRAARAGLGAALSADGLAAANAAADLARHREWLDATNASLSWRLTAPLRAAKRRVRGSPRSSRH